MSEAAVRADVRREVESIVPLDALEAQTQRQVLSWIDSGAPLCRVAKPATPPMHLVSYFALVDGDHILLVDHINAQLWLPTGGHVEPGEHPRDTVLREVREELAVDGRFLFEGPLLLTSTQTVGRTAGHTDVSLWYVLEASVDTALEFDTTEFHDVRWFPHGEVPLERTDPHMARFLAKLASAQALAPGINAI